MTKRQKKDLSRIIVTIILLVVLNFIDVNSTIKLCLYIIPYLIIGHEVLINAFYGLKNGEVLDENFLMVVATIGAFLIGAVKTGDYIEGIAVMLFFQIGELFEKIAVGKSRKNISELMDIRPDYANVEIDGILTQVDPYEVEVGTIIVVQPGEKIPIDGIVVSGTSTLNTSALTGESVPREISTGDEIISGCINLNGVLYIKTTKEFGESTVSKILDLVENASSKKSKSENFISKFARVYTPVVCISALLLAILPPIVRMTIMKLSPNWFEWIYRALTFLVISCPCALVISVPLSFFACIGGASKKGILIKGSNYIETLAGVDCVVCDKTGTLTKGVFEVEEIHENRDDKIIEYATLAEIASSHPISKSLQKAYGKPIDRNRVKDIEEISGKGIVAVVDDKKVVVGNDKLMKLYSIDYKLCGNDIGTIIHVAVDNEYMGHIVINDKIKDNAPKAITDLRNVGVKNIVMLTGDAKSVANKVGNVLGLDKIYSELLPQDKVEKVEELLKKQKGKLAFVGDGLNDAPVLSRADVGFAMGAMGSEAAIESADVVLMDDDPCKIAKAIKISRKCMAIVKQNIAFSIGVKVLCLILGAIGIANMWLAIFADVGVMVIAVLNSVRALFVDNI